MSEPTSEVNPFVVPAAPADQASIVDTILTLDELASGDIRRPERTARFATRPDLEADIENLEAELASLVDDNGNPLTPPGEQSLGQQDGRTALVVAGEIHALQTEYAASFRSLRLRALDGESWSAFRIKYRDVIEGDDDEKRNEMLDELVPLCAIAPALTPEQWANFRGKYGGTATDEVRYKAWVVNRESGISVPKSLLSSLVLRRQRPAQS